MVDAANVVGSVPDGWWRDRAGAAARMHAALLAEPPRTDRVVLVLEGDARAGVAEGTVTAEGGTVTTVHAPGSADDHIVTLCRDLAAHGESVTLVTADRGLITRVAGLVSAIAGPRSIPRR